jgi:hypothetical protein
MRRSDDAFGDRVVLTTEGDLAIDAIASAFGHRVAAGRAVAFQSFATTATTAATAVAFARLGIVAFGSAGFRAWGDRLDAGRDASRNTLAAFLGVVVAGGIAALIDSAAFIAVVAFDRAVGATATTAPATALAILGRTGVDITAAGAGNCRIGITNFGVALRVVGEFVDRRSRCARGAVRPTRRASLTGGSGAGEGVEFADGGFGRSRRFGQSLVASRLARLTWLADFARGITGFTVVAAFARFAGRFTAAVTAAFATAFPGFARLTTFALFTGFTGFAGLAVVAQLAALARRALFFGAARWA